MNSTESFFVQLVKAGGPANGGSKAKHVRAKITGATDEQYGQLAAMWQARRCQLPIQRSAVKTVHLGSLDAEITLGFTSSDRLKRTRSHAEYQRREDVRKADEAKALEERRAILICPASELWSKSETERVALHVNYSARWSEFEAIKATLAGLVRAFKRLGWSYRHGSVSRSGRMSSRYLIKDGVEIRLSDHRVPIADDRPWSFAAQDRSAYREAFGGPKWHEIIIDRESLNDADLVGTILAEVVGEEVES